MSKHEDGSMVINEWRANTVSVINMILLIVLIVLGLTGHLVKNTGGNDAASKGDIAAIIKDAVKDNAPAAAPTPTPAAPTPAPAPASTSIDLWELEAFYETAYVDGNKEAKVSVIEFSDVQCPFCQRHVNGGTLDAVKEKYGDDVSIVFAHFPLSFHQNAQKAGEALECAGKIGGEEGFFAFKKAFFAAWGDSSLAIAKEAATEAGMDATELETCVNGGEFAQKVTDQMTFGRKLGVTGTPGNIVMNNENRWLRESFWSSSCKCFRCCY